MFLRYWWEVSSANTGLACSSAIEAKYSGNKWFPYNKGGNFRHWYGNNEFVVNWQAEGRDIHNYSDLPITYSGAPVRAKNFYFRSSVSWTDLGGTRLAARFYPPGYVFDVAGHSAFFENEDQQYLILGFLNSAVAETLSTIINNSFHFQVGDFRRLPFPYNVDSEKIKAIAKEAISISKSDWDRIELSPQFNAIGLLDPIAKHRDTKASFSQMLTRDLSTISHLKAIMQRNNEEFISSFGLESIIKSEIPLDKISLCINPNFIYSNNLDSEELDSRYRCDTFSRLLSYSIGCIMGRYSLDREGLVYAHVGNQGFAELAAEGAYKSFPADDDGILPLTDQEWFSDDAANRFREFVRTVWAGQEGATELEQSQLLQKNLTFVADSLCLHAIKPKRGESALDTIRRYLSTQFYKDHLKTYKKRPIYWLFSSGKHKAFECLVYLHRYNDGTLARMRTEYVIPLTAKLNTYTNKLATDIENETVTSEKKRLEKELATLHNQQAELATFDEKLRHHADQRISLDLDDGVKVNYGKFGDLLAEVKAVTGDKGD